MRAPKILVVALASSAAAAGMVLASPAPAMASGVVFCNVETEVGSSLWTYECELDVAGPANEVWNGPDLNRAESDGTAFAHGECHSESNPANYYTITVTYSGASGSPASTLFSCSGSV